MLKTQQFKTLRSEAKKPQNLHSACVILKAVQVKTHSTERRRAPCHPVMCLHVWESVATKHAG